LPGLGSIQLAWEEDSFGQPNASIWSLEAMTAPAVWEIDGPDASAATMLAGWNPDQTWWLTDTLALATPNPQPWIIDADSGRWHGQSQ
jgi:hypothetical protein